MHVRIFEDSILVAVVAYKVSYYKWYYTVSHKNVPLCF